MKFQVYDLHLCSIGESIQEILVYSSSLADIVARTSYNVEELAKELSEFING